MSQTKTAQHAQLVSHLSKSTGTSEADISKVLDQLGLSNTLNEAEAQLGAAAVQQINPQDIRLSIRLGRLLVAI